MPREISGLRIARSFITPSDTAVSRVIDFQLGARQGIAISAVLGSMLPDPSNTTISAAGIVIMNAVHTLHLESGSLEVVPDVGGEDEDTIDSEVFYRQVGTLIGNDDLTTEFRASITYHSDPNGMVEYPRDKPVFSARNITHRGISTNSSLDFLAHVTIYYTFVEFSLSELGLILARRT